MAAENSPEPIRLESGGVEGCTDDFAVLSYVNLTYFLFKYLITHRHL